MSHSQHGCPSQRRDCRPRPAPGVVRLQVAVIAVVASLCWSAQSCAPPTRAYVEIPVPAPGVDQTFHPLFMQVNKAPFAAPFEVTLNDVDITAFFKLEKSGARDIVNAIDVWGTGVVLEGENTLVVRAGEWEATRVFDAIGDPYADAVVSFIPGTGAGTGQAELPDVVLGGPQGLGLFLGGLDVLSLGAGGVIELEFTDNVIVDRPGVDFTVFENPFFTQVLGVVGEPFAEPGQVSVSQDGVTWYVFDDCETAPLEPPFHPGCAGVLASLSDVLDVGTPHPSIPSNVAPASLVGMPVGSLELPEGSGGDSFDLEDVGLTWARFVRIEDIGPALGQAGTVGFDLDAVVAINSAGTTDANGNGVPDAAE